MKKFFTSVFAALLMAAPVGNLSAQSAPMTKAEQDQVVKEVLPVVFEQIKEHAGIDILGWARPQLVGNVLTGFPLLETNSMLRAAQGEPVTAKPDSIIINASAINPAMAKIVGDMKVTFEGYSKKELNIANKKVELELPSTIVVNTTTMGTMAKLFFDVSMKPGDLLTFKMNVDVVLFKNPRLDLVDFSLSQDKATYKLEGFLKIGDGLKTIVKLAATFAPDKVKPLPELDYVVSVDLLKAMTTNLSTLPISLYGVSTTRIPMGDAVLNLNLKAMPMPLKSIYVTSYDKTSAKPNKWNKLAFGLESDKQDPRDLTLTVDKFDFANGFGKDSVYIRSTVFKMSDDRALPADVKSAAQTVVTRVVNELANEGKASWYKLNITQGNKDNMKKVMDIEVTPSRGEKYAEADIDIVKYDKNEQGTPMLVKAIAEFGGKKQIKIEYSIAGKTVVTGYFTSNAADVLSNESVVVTNVKVIPTANGVRILNAERANYRIYSISGALAANGTVSGDEMISTSNLTKGIYIIAVEANGVTQSIKFVR